jgi:hypothetical protein
MSYENFKTKVIAEVAEFNGKSIGWAEAKISEEKIKYYFEYDPSDPIQAAFEISGEIHE